MFHTLICQTAATAQVQTLQIGHATDMLQPAVRDLRITTEVQKISEKANC
jgi:hypothetical protein